MFMNILIVVLVLVIAYAWMVRGVFSAMLHALCAFFAGAIAFAAWEPLALILVNASPERGFFSFIESIAWGVALIVPFAVSMLLLRIATDKLVPGNIKNANAVDYAGGAIFGIITGVICTGMLVIGIGNMRVATDFLGYQPLWYSADRATGAGSLVKTDKLWVPTDTIVAKIYGKLSDGSLSTNQSLSYWYPELELTGFASRVSPEGMGRNALRPEDFGLKSSYVVGSESGMTADELLAIRGGGKQRYVDINNEPITNGRIFGYVIEFEPGAKERGEKGAGQLIVSNGHVRMLAEDANGNTKTIFPLAAISESNTPGEFGRWRFDAESVFISSTGGKSRVPMAFEFAVFVKNVRVGIDSISDPVEFPSNTRRNRLIRTGSILKSQSASIEYNTEFTVTYDPNVENSFIQNTARMLGVISKASANRGLTVDEDGGVVSGEGVWDVKTEVGRSNAGTSKKLRVERYATADDQVIVKINAGAESSFGFLSEGAQIAPLDEPLVLLDTKGSEYEAIGFEYKDATDMRIRITRGTTLSGIQDTPSLSTTRSDQELFIVFIVTKGVEIDRFIIGDQMLARFNPPLPADL
jgi:hypothetical protein